MTSINNNLGTIEDSHIILFIHREVTKNRRHSANITVYRIRFPEKISRELRCQRARSHPFHVAAERDGKGTCLAFSEEISIG